MPPMQLNVIKDKQYELALIKIYTAYEKRKEETLNGGES